MKYRLIRNGLGDYILETKRVGLLGLFDAWEDSSYIIDPNTKKEALAVLHKMRKEDARIEEYLKNVLSKTVIEE